MVIVLIGLGYVGAPLCMELAKHFDVIGFDIDRSRVKELSEFKDRTNELSTEELETTAYLTSDVNEIQAGTVYIVTVPTPILDGNIPDLTPVKNATKLISTVLKSGDIVVYESTVYPGVTEEICIPLLQESGLKHLIDFNVGYSPERINPGDKVHTLTSTTKIVSADTPEALGVIQSIYGTITKTYSASTIKVAEAAKVIENIQRDVNIALMNELAQVFNRLDIDTNDVIDAAKSKWNFLPFRPGLVGGHCISVDPYYLSHKAAAHGFVADVILSAREINDSVPEFISQQFIKKLVQENLINKNLTITILGLSFKENVPDIRNSKVLKIVDQLNKYGLKSQLVDPIADEKNLMHDYNLSLTKDPKPANALILAVPHDEFGKSWKDISKYLSEDKNIVFDIKGVLSREDKPENVILWRL